jgi:transposase
MKIHALGIDLGKTVFHLVGLDSSGQVGVRKRCSRTQLFAFTGNLQVQLIGMEACSGAHFLGKALRAQGHDVRLMPAQYVKPYVKTNKSDYIDAEAIAEAVQRPRMRFVGESKSTILVSVSLYPWLPAYLHSRRQCELEVQTDK